MILYHFNEFDHWYQKYLFSNTRWVGNLENFVSTVGAVGDQATHTLKTLPPQVKINTISIFVLSNNEAAKATFEWAKKEFRGVIVVSLNLPKGGCGKVGPDGEEVMQRLLPAIKVRIGQILNEWRSKYGIVIRTLVELKYPGGTSSALTLADPNWAIEAINPIMYFRILSLSRKDAEFPTGNSVIEIPLLYPSLVESAITGSELKGSVRPPIVAIFDQGAEAAKTNESIVATITTIVGLTLSVGVNKRDISDVDTMMSHTLMGTIDYATRKIKAKQITIDDGATMLKKITTESSMDIQKITAFDHKYSIRNAFSLLSEITMTSQTVNGIIAQSLEPPGSERENLLDGMWVQETPFTSNAIRFGKMEAVQLFIKRYFPIAIERSIDYIYDIQKKYPKYKGLKSLNLLLDWYYHEKDLKCPI